MITGQHIRDAIHALSLDPKATPDERHRAGHLSYYLTTWTADRIAAKLNKEGGTDAK